MFLRLSNDDIISWRPGLKTSVENGISWSEIGSEFGEPSGTVSSNQDFPGVGSSSLTFCSAHSPVIILSIYTFIN